MKFYLSFASGIAMLALMFGTGLVLTAAFGKDTEPEKTASAIILAQCGKVIGVIAVDEHGKLHPVPPESMSDDILGAILKEVGDSYITAVTPCKSVEKII